MSDTYSIIAGAAIQFIDYDLDLSAEVEGKPLAGKRKPFHVSLKNGPPRLITLDEIKGDDGDESGYVDRQTRQPLDLHYEVKLKNAFDCCLNRWLPMPFLVRSGGIWSDDKKPKFGYGPTDWVRGFLSRLGDENSLKYRLTLVFDPQVEEGKANIKTADEYGAVIYHALSREDVIHNSSFALATAERDYGWFVDLPWINDALKQNQISFRKNPKQEVVTVNEEYFPDSGHEHIGKVPTAAMEHLAVYSAYLEGLGLLPEEQRLGEVDLVNPNPATKDKPIDVDLVLDIGNSRLTGVLVETSPQGETKLTNCYALPVRDLSEPDKIYREPLGTQVEFSEPYFGQRELSLGSRRHSKSFPWPSTVRLGPEAARLANAAREDQGPTGMSSPKRYLWDTRQRDMLWYLNNKYEHHGSKEVMAVGQAPDQFLMRVNVVGMPLSALQPEEGRKRIPIPKSIKSGYKPEDNMVAFESRYSRSSLMMFLLSEIVAQALAAINNPQVRCGRNLFPDKPRRLSRIILTVPTAMPLVEQNIFKTWALLAVETIWSALGWKEFYQQDNSAREGTDLGNDFRRSPQVRCDWDEATCTQVVWLYNEIKERFHTNAGELFELLGREREFKFDSHDSAERRPSLRMASIDMGGGTTDLSITTYAIRNPGVSSPLIIPFQEFRDGFNMAGDDIMNKIIKAHFIEEIVQAAKNQVVGEAEELVRRLFREDNETPQAEGRGRKNLRSQFVARVAAPLALKILKLYEDIDFRGEKLKDSFRVGEVLLPLLPADKAPDQDFQEVLDYLERPLREAGWKDFRLLDQVLEVDFKKVDENVRDLLEGLMTDLGEVIKLYDCDILILTGRPSRWPAMMKAPYRNLSLPVDRIVHMHKYKVGAGYPFVRHGRIEDPKTTVVIGAIICALAEGSLEGVAIDTSNFVPQPTTRYMGILDEKGELGKVWFGPIDVFSNEPLELETDIEFSAPLAVGFRQLGCPRWTTTRLYRLEYKNTACQEQAAKPGCRPYNVHLKYSLEKFEDGEGDAPGQIRCLRRTEGQLTVESISNNKGDEVPKSHLNVRLQTLRHDRGFWLDTGILDD